MYILMKFTFLNLGTKRPMTYFQKKKIVKKNMNKKIMIKKSQNHYPCDFPRTDEKISGGKRRIEAHFRVPGEDQAKKFENHCSSI